MLQLRDSERGGQLDPPFAGCTVMLRVRLWVPDPHGWLHVLQADQPDTAQLTGDGKHAPFEQ